MMSNTDVHNCFKIFLICFFGVCMVTAARNRCDNPIKNKDVVAELADLQLKFAFDMYKASDKAGFNPAMSPISLGMTLAMTATGAGGNTAQELNNVLGINVDTMTNMEVNKGFSNVVRSICKQKSSNWSLSIANQMYVTKSLSLSVSYAKTVFRYYRSRVVPIDFTQNDAAANINKWVRKQTRGRIRNLVDQQQLNEFTKLLLVNAIYFKAKWTIPFESYLTARKDFKLNSGSTATVDMMSTTDYYYHSFSDELNCRMLSMDYVGDRVTMYVLLPNDVDGLSNLEKKLTPEAFKSLRNSLRIERLRVMFPKFRSDQTKISYIDTLRRLGVKDALSAAANFSGIFGNEANQLTLSDLDHMVYLNVDEQGTEAAGATALKVTLLSRPFDFEVDHPFLYIIYDKLTNLILFMGRVTFPKSDNVRG